MRIGLIAFLGFFTFNMHAAHIVGGDIYYECLGNNNYRITLKVYKDCFASGTNVADFDQQAPISIFSGSTRITDLYVGYSSRTNIPPDLSNPCLIPPSNVCVEEAVYVTEVNLPYNPNGYIIAYQRCCRNHTITNLNNPEATGATYTIEITDNAQTSCNNSPVYNQFPPIVICNNEPIDFDHAATDQEGDSLVYEFCTPFRGFTQADPGPNPAATPPFNPVSFVTPPYTVNTPMAGNPVVNIDPETGFISGAPQIVGQYVVGVCVYEYRNGQLLSVVQRDFQFNVANCAPTIVAQVENDSVVGGQDFVITSCGPSSVTFINESYQSQFINGYYWEFYLPDTVTSTATNAVVDFPGVGSYDGFLIANPGTPCADTAFMEINIFPFIEADFSFEYDTSCAIGPFSFSDSSVTGSNQFTTTYWNFGDGNTSFEDDPVHQYVDAGSYSVVRHVEDINGCVDEKIVVVDWFPASVIQVGPSIREGCRPLEVEFVNNSSPINGYSILWDFGDGNTSNEVSPIHIYEDAGVYTVSLEINSPTGCLADTTFADLIEVYEIPEAGFECGPMNPNNFNPTVTFTDASMFGATWFWDFGNGATSTEQNPVYSYPDTGVYTVTQYVYHESGCPDSITKVIDVEPKFTYFLPNAFTPNFDDVNDGYRGTGDFFGIREFEMKIWNRWGERIFQTNDPFEEWNGRKNNTGAMSKNGVYVCLVTITGARGDYHELKSFATLIR